MTHDEHKAIKDFTDSWFINWNNTVTKKHGVTSKASELFALGDLMHEVLMETLTQKWEADEWLRGPAGE